MSGSVSEWALIDVFFGSPLEHDSERRALARIRRELQRLGTDALIFANFVAGRPQRQIDFLVVTPARCVMIELKTIDQQLPLIGHANGPWEQRLPNATRLMDRNFFTQAREATFAVSDAMRETDSTGASRFYRLIDTVICLAPGVPEDSAFETFDYVEVLGIEDLADRLTTPGRRPRWGVIEWEAFARKLCLHREIDDSPEAFRARAAADEVQDYRRRFRASFEVSLHELIPVDVVMDGTAMKSTLLAGSSFPDHSITLLLGSSGSGKSHLALHTALRAIQSNHLAVWLRCGEYEPGRLSSLLARAVAPFSTVPPVALLQKALDLGLTVLIVLDGFNECSEATRNQLLEQLSALRLHVSCAVLMTSTNRPEFPESVAVREVTLTPPGGDDRVEILRSHGLPTGAFVPEVFRTPFELSLAAGCYRELSADASQTELLDTYIRLSGASEEIRFGLRIIACLMDSKLRSSLPLTDTYAALRRQGVSPAAIDRAMAFPLLMTQQGRVRFSHELFARFLTAEHLVATSNSGAELGRALREAPHLDLLRHGIILERDPQRRHDALLRVSNPQLLAEAAAGEFGQPTAVRILGAMRSLLGKSSQVISEAAFTTANPDDTFLARWASASPWTEPERALITAAGLGLADGLLEEEIGQLLDRTDEACLLQVPVLIEAGGHIPISVLVAATYAMPNDLGARALPASMIANAVHMSSFERWNKEGTSGVAASLLRGSGTHSWGRLYIAAELCQPICHPDDAQSLPELVKAGWSAGGYHLQLRVLMAAESAARTLNADEHQRMAAVLETLEAKDILLSTQLVETLAAYDMISTSTTLQDIQNEIEELLSAPLNSRTSDLAQNIVSKMFERDEIIGPYYDAVYSLTDADRTRLFVLAAGSEQASFHQDWIIARLANSVPSLSEVVKETLDKEASSVRQDTVMPQVAVMAHLHALRGLANLGAGLPTGISTADDRGKKAWRCFDQIIFDLYRGVDSGRSAEIWRQLLSDLAPEAIHVLYSIHWAGQTPEGPSLESRLYASHPQEFRALFEWALSNIELVTASHRYFGKDSFVRFIIPVLGRIGTESAADMLRELITDSEVGELAVAAIRNIEARF